VPPLTEKTGIEGAAPTTCPRCGGRLVAVGDAERFLECTCGYKFDVLTSREVALETGSRDVITSAPSLSLSSDLTVYFASVRLINPALDIVDDHLILSHPLPAVRTLNERNGTQKERGEFPLFVITDQGELFEATEDNFMKRGWFGRTPAPIIQPRWSPKSIHTFLEGRAEKVNPWEVYSKVKGLVDYYLDFAASREAPTIFSLWILGTYFFIIFEYFPYMKLGGEKGSGKTKAGSLAALLAFNGRIFANESKAVIYRTAQDTRGTIVIDEGENLSYKSEESAAYHAVLNSGWQRNGSALLTDKDTMRPVQFSTYSPKLICSIGGLTETLEDRSFAITMLKTLDRVKASLEVSFVSEEWQEVRDSLYLLMVQRWREVKDLADSLTNEMNLNGRLWNLTKPFIALARWLDRYRPEGAPNVEEDVRAFVRLQEGKKSVLAMQSLAGSVLQALEELLGEERLGEADGFRLDLRDVRERVIRIEGPGSEEWIKPRKVADTLRNLNLYGDAKKVMGRYRFTISRREVREAKERLGIVDQETKVELVDEKKSQGSLSSPLYSSSTTSPLVSLSTNTPAEKEIPDKPEAHLLYPSCSVCKKELGHNLEPVYTVDKRHYCQDHFPGLKEVGSP